MRRIAGVRVPVAGRVSMDLITLDVTDVPPSGSRPDAKSNSSATRFRSKRSRDAGGTAAYEILTSLAPRVPRHYAGSRGMNIFAPIGRAFLALLAQIGRLALFTVSRGVELLSPADLLVSTSLRQMHAHRLFLAAGGGADGVLHRRRAGAADLSSAATATAPKPSCRRSWCSASRASLGPVIAGLMVAGRVAAAIAAEIGTMRVTEQIDALTTLSTNPIKYLVVPRLIAAVISHADPGRDRRFHRRVRRLCRLDRRASVSTARIYLKNTVDFVTSEDVTSGLIKAAVFGFIIALMGCYNGFHSKGGAQGVGAATTNAVVSSSILILAANYVLTSDSVFANDAMARHTPKIELRGVKKRFGPKVVLDGVDLTIDTRPVARRHRRLGHRQVGHHQMRARHPAPRRGHRSWSTART